MSAVSFEHFKLPQEVVLQKNAKQTLVAVVWNTLTEIQEEATRM